jgi:hypothetical protein
MSRLLVFTLFRGVASYEFAACACKRVAQCSRYDILFVDADRYFRPHD